MGFHMQGPVGAQTILNGRLVDYFAGSGYLGLQNHPAVLQVAAAAVQQYGFSTATSRGGYGEHPLYDALEEEACAYFAAAKILYFASGYMGPSILTQANGGLRDHYFVSTARDGHLVTSRNCYRSGKLRNTAHCPIIRESNECDYP